MTRHPRASILFLALTLTVTAELKFGPAIAAAQTAPAAAAKKRPLLTGIDHVAFRTSDAAAARRFYGDLLGLASPADRRGPLTFRVNARQTVFVEPGLPADVDERLLHIAFATPDLQALAAYLKEKGVAFDGPAQQTPCGRSGLRVVDYGGHAIEFVQESAIVAGGPAPRALSSRLLHAGITVHSEIGENALYRDVLGMTEIWRGGFAPDKTNWVNLRLPESGDYLEYMLRDQPSTKRQLGVDHHICLVVPDIQAAWEQVRSRTPDADRGKLAPPQIGRNDKWQINLYDPDGTRVELMEPYNVK
jgi:catechol 2,3-dioxygenase-like lactoylglutathione lyase family enzyme